tara:strand:+ start:706 stop:1275 length:570 start_codon:yes stop_codon:yes gene_type:complete
MTRCVAICLIAAVFAGCSDEPILAPPVVTAEVEQSQTTPDVRAVTEDERFDNPVDKKTYIAEGGWKTYKPQQPAPAAENARIHNGGVRLLTNQDELAQRTAVESLAAFIKRAEASAQSTLHEVTTNAQVLAQFTCTPEKHDVQLAHQGNVTQDQLQAFYDALLALEALPVSSGEVSFQLTIQIDPVQQQ